MKNVSMFAVAALIVATSAPQAAKAEDVLTGFCGSGVSAKCNEECCEPGWGGGALFGSFEATFFRFHQSGGVQQGGFGAANDEFDYDFSPRYTLGYIRSSGLGTRARFWDYDENAVLNSSFFGPAGTLNYGIDTHTIDVEGFYRADLNCTTSVEISGGVRQNSLDQSLIVTDGTIINPLTGGTTNALFVGYDGIGGTVALEGRQQVGIGALYARGRWSIVQGDLKANDAAGNNITIPDTTVLQTEVATGVEVERYLSNGAILTLRLGAEWQQWNDAIFVVDQFDVNNNHNMADAGFGGVVGRVALEY